MPVSSRSSINEVQKGLGEEARNEESSGGQAWG